MNNQQFFSIMYEHTRSPSLLGVCKNIYRASMFGRLSDQIINKRRAVFGVHQLNLYINSWLVPETSLHCMVLLLNHSSKEYHKIKAGNVPLTLIDMVWGGRIQLDDHIEIRPLAQGITTEEVMYNYVY